jgi:transposase
MLSDARWAVLEPLTETCRPKGKTPAQDLRRPRWIHDNRDRIERRRARLEEGRAVATRYQKTAVRFAGVLGLAAALDGLQR